MIGVCGFIIIVQIEISECNPVEDLDELSAEPTHEQRLRIGVELAQRQFAEFQSARVILGAIEVGPQRQIKIRNGSMLGECQPQRLKEIGIFEAHKRKAELLFLRLLGFEQLAERASHAVIVRAEGAFDGGLLRGPRRIGKPRAQEIGEDRLQPQHRRVVFAAEQAPIHGFLQHLRPAVMGEML